MNLKSRVSHRRSLSETTKQEIAIHLKDYDTIREEIRLYINQLYNFSRGYITIIGLIMALHDPILKGINLRENGDALSYFLILIAIINTLYNLMGVSLSYSIAKMGSYCIQLSYKIDKLLPTKNNDLLGWDKGIHTKKITWGEFPIFSKLFSIGDVIFGMVIYFVALFLTPSLWVWIFHQGEPRDGVFIVLFIFNIILYLIALGFGTWVFIYYENFNDLEQNYEEAKNRLNNKMYLLTRSSIGLAMILLTLIFIFLYKN